MASLDTNILARLLVGDVQAQQRAAEKLLASDQEFNVSDLVISELVFVLEKGYKLSRDLIASSLDLLLNRRNINANRSLFVRAILLYTSNPSLSFVDCCLVVQAELNNALPLWTFDKALVAKSTGKARLLK